MIVRAICTPALPDPLTIMVHAAVMTEPWPVLTGEHCVLRVLDEDDLPQWHTDEGEGFFGQQQEFYVEQPAPSS